MGKTKTDLEKAQDLIKAQSQKEINDCVIELQKLQAEENNILIKFGCEKTIRGNFVGAQINYQFAITKK